MYLAQITHISILQLSLVYPVVETVCIIKLARLANVLGIDSGTMPIVSNVTIPSISISL